MSSFDEIIAQVRSKPLFSASELIEKFGWEEFFVFALMLGVSAAIGIFFWWKGKRKNFKSRKKLTSIKLLGQHDNATFLLGGRNMGVFPMTMSLVAR